MRLVRLTVLALMGTTVCCCSRPKSGDGQQSAKANSSAASSVIESAAAVASSAPSAAPKDLEPPVCKIQSKKVWTAGANKLTGLTEAILPDGRAAVGFAVGTRPSVLVVGADAQGALLKVSLGQSKRLATQPKGGTRYLYRVTPVKVQGDSVSAFVDYEDKYKDKRRTIVCGPSDTDSTRVLFDGIHYADQKDLTPEQQSKLFKVEGTTAIYSEVHTCRSFAHVETGETWILGSGLQGKKQPDGSIKWNTTFFVNAGSPGNDKHIHTTELKTVTTNTPDYEVPVSYRAKDGSLLVAARHANHLIVGFLDGSKSVRGEFASYAGFPTLPDIAPDGDDVVLSTSFAKGRGDFGLRALRVSSKDQKLPKQLRIVVTDQEQKESETDPAFVRDAKGQHWMAHIEGERGKGQLSLSPLNSEFRAIGRSYTVTEENEQATVARVIPMPDKGIMVVFLRNGEKSAELVSEEVHCEVKK